MWKRKEQYIQCMVTMTIIWAAGPSMSLQGYSLPVNSPIGTQLRQAKLNLVPPNESQGQGFGASSKPQPNKKSSNPPAGEFELQELRAQLDAMARQNIKLENLTPMKRIELESYVKAVVGNKVSPIPLRDMASPFNLPKLLGTWRLGFSTEDVTLNALPPGATVFVKIKELPEGKKDGTLDYILKFQQGAMKELRAKSTFTLDPGPINPGLLTFAYQDITSGLFGMNIPVGLFGMLKGRVNYIETIYFDGTYWIERGYTSEGKPYYNVYFREQSERT